MLKYDFLFLSFLFLETLFSQGNEAAFALLEKDTSSIDVIIMPYDYQDSWKLIVIDNRQKYRKVTYYDSQFPTKVPSFVSVIISYFVFDFSKRQKKFASRLKPITFVSSILKKKY